jgi:hypothetical protein
MRQNETIFLTWTEDGYSLETAPALEGPWNELSTKGRIYTANRNEVRRFYRLRHQ